MERIIDYERIRQTSKDHEITPSYITQLHQIESYPIPFQTLDAVVVLGAPLELRVDENGFNSYEFPDIMEERVGEGSILTAGEWRALAAARISSEHNDKPSFLVTGGVQELQVDSLPVLVSKAEHMGRKMRQFGVPEEKIIVIGREGRGNTKGNFLDIQDYLQQNGFDNSQHLQLGLITGLFQLPRTLSIPDYFPEELSWFAKHNTAFHPIAAERLLLEKNDEYAQRVKCALQTEGAMKRVQMEIQGIGDMKKGKYRSKLS